MGSAESLLKKYPFACTGESHARPQTAQLDGSKVQQAKMKETLFVFSASRSWFTFVFERRSTARTQFLYVLAGYGHLSGALECVQCHLFKQRNHSSTSEFLDGVPNSRNYALRAAYPMLKKSLMNRTSYQNWNTLHQFGILTNHTS